MWDRGIYGLVLAGGDSEKMGMSKAELIYYDRPQWAYCSSLLAPFCDKVFVSMRSENQLADVPDELQIPDMYPGTGPLSAILTAIKTHPEKTWLILACDKPGIDRAVMHRLIRFRDPDKLVSCFSDEADTIDPYLSFWEPGIVEPLSEFAKKNSSTNEFIRQVNAEVIPLESKYFSKLKSIQTPEERKAFLKLHSTGNDKYQEL